MLLRMPDVEEATPPVVAGSGDRDASGRFVAGHAKLGGRKRGAYDLRQVVADDLGPDRMRADLIAAYEAVARLAAGGDINAARVLFDRLVGPIAVKVSGDDDGDPIRIVDRDTAAREMAAILAMAAARTEPPQGAA